MKLICDRALLANAIAGVSKAVTQRSSIPVLEGILMKAEGFSLTLTGYDLEMGITTTIEANVLEPGDAVLPAKLLGDMVRRLPSDEVEINAQDSGATTVKGGITEFDIMSLNPGDFPDLPNPGADKTLDMNTADLQEMVDTTLFAVSTDDKKPAHTGALFSITPDKLTVVALDGYRLAIIEKPVMATKEIDIIIPAKTLSEVVKLFGEEDEVVHISANRRFVVFATRSYTVISRLIEGEFLDYKRVIPEGKLFGEEDEVVHISANRRFVVFATRSYTVISRLIEGEFLDYKRVIPEGYKTRVTVDVRDFATTIERASLIITERLKNPLQVMFDDHITVRCQTTLGKVVDELPAQVEGEPVEIGFNNRYLLVITERLKNPLQVMFDDHITVRCQTTLGKVVDELPAQVEGEPVEIGFNNRYLLDALRYSRCDKLVFELSGPLSPVKVLPKDGGDFLFLVLPVRFKNN